MTTARLITWPTAAEALDFFDGLLSESATEPSKRVAATRAELARLAADEAALLAEVRGLVDPDPAAQLETVTEAFIGRKISVEEALATLSAATRSTTKDRQRLVNRVTFRTSRASVVEMRKLGDALISDVLNPWLRRTVGEVFQDAAVVADAGYAKIAEAAVWAAENEIRATTDLTPFEALRTPAVVRNLAILRAERKVAAMLRVWGFADDLRDRGVVPAMADGSVTPLRYRWAAPHRLPDLAGQHREVLWTCRAIVAEAGPAVATAAQAEATAPVAA